MRGPPSGVPPMNTSMYSPMTRPRMVGADPSWIDVLAAVENVRETAPMGSSMTARAA